MSATLPTHVSFADAFCAVLNLVVEDGYPQLLDKPDENADVEGRKADLANAISASLGALGIVEPSEAGDWLGELYSLAEQIGITTETP